MAGSPWRPGARTRLAAVIGDPVRHSLSPRLHNAAFRALGLDWVYLAFEVPSGGAAAALAGARALGIDGLNVTMPHKAAVAAAVDRLDEEAAALGAVNTVVHRGDELRGHSTDGPGFLAAVRASHGFDPAGVRALVVGAGGAARAVVRALGGAGAAEIVVAARRADAAVAAAALAPGVARPGSADEAGEADLVVNATPIGMRRSSGRDDTAELPLDPARLGPGQLVVDLVYDPLVTPLVARARERGATAVNGVGMLLHQAGLAFELWTGEEAPLAAMAEAVEAELASVGAPAGTPARSD